MKCRNELVQKLRPDMTSIVFLIHFKFGDQVWLHLKKECFTGPYQKMKPLRYGPYSILKQIGEKYFELDIPGCLGIRRIFNVDILLPYHAPLLEQNEL